MIIFVAGIFCIVYFLRIVTASGYLATIDIIIFVIVGMVLFGFGGYFAKRWKIRRRTKKIAQKNPHEFGRRQSDPTAAFESAGNVSMGQVLQWRETEQDVSEIEGEHLEKLSYLWRINTVGEMAAMVAHELNQPLCAILNYSDVCMKLLRCNENEKDRMTEAIEEINIQAKRAGRIIQSLKRLVAHNEPRLSTVHINKEIVQEAVKIVRSEAGRKNIDIQTRLADDLPAICVDKIQIIQVLLNLIRNAFDAMRNTQIEHHRLTITTWLTEDKAIGISVRDTGEGMPDSIAGKVFDTFFTTKPTGVGIGLVLCRRIIEAHGGKIWSRNNPDCGATSTFTLPLKGSRRYGELQTDSIYCR